MPGKVGPGGDTKAELAEKKQTLLDLTGSFCDAALNADYKRLCKKAVEALVKQRPSPLLRGKPEIWAAGIVHAIGSINFLFDKSQKPHASSADIAAYFKVAPGSASQKAGAVRDLLELSHFSTDFLTKQMRGRMAPTFDLITQMEQMFGGSFAASNSLDDVIENGEFIARDSPLQSHFYDLTERYQSRGVTEALIQGLQQLIDQDPEYYDPYLMLRDMLLELGITEPADALLEDAYQRALARITDAKGNWPPRMEWGWLQNRPIIRTLLNKALADWTAGRKEDALALLRKLLRSNPGDNIGAREYILAIRLGMTFEEFERKFESQFGYDALKMMTWFDENIDRFPEEFGWWKQAAQYEAG